MPALRISVLALVAVATIFSATGTAFGETVPKLDIRILRELRSRNPEAADQFEQANKDREAGNHAGAAEHYGRVTELVPDFDHAWRRQGYELLALGRRDEAISRMRTAVRLDGSAWNSLGLAEALATATERSKPSQAELVEAVALAKSAARSDPTDPWAAIVSCDIAIETQDWDWLKREAERVVQLDPGIPAGPYFLAISAAVAGDRAEAERQINRARALGMPEAARQSFLRGLDQLRSPWERFGAIGALVLGIWAVGLLLLFGVGSLLSRATLQASRRVPQQQTGSAAGLDAKVRAAYRWTLGACCVYYYISIPLVIGMVILVGGGVVYAILATGYIPVKILAIVVIITLVSLWAILKSFFIRSREEDPGLKIGPDEHQRLRGVLDEVASKVGTRTVSNVYLTPGTEVAVMERGGVYRQLSGHAERCLILGIGALDGMRMRPFRAVLAHEYGHFSNRDTAGGGFALSVRRSLTHTAMSLARGGAAAWYNPAWLFVNGFYRLFLRISQGASRLQEVLADRWAAFTYGAEAFKEGLRHVIERSIRFDAHANSVLKEVIEGEKALANLYSYVPASAVKDEGQVADMVEESIQKEPSPYDSHPRPIDRFEWVDGLGTVGGPFQPDDDDDVWSLFDDRVAVERLLTDAIRANVSETYGVSIPSEVAAT